MCNTYSFLFYSISSKKTFLNPLIGCIHSLKNIDLVREIDTQTVIIQCHKYSDREVFLGAEVKYSELTYFKLEGLVKADAKAVYVPRVRGIFNLFFSFLHFFIFNHQGDICNMFIMCI